MRFFTSTLYATIAMGILEGCSCSMAAAPTASLPSAGAARQTASDHPLQRQTNETVAIQTYDGNYWTAVGGGGGKHAKNCRRNADALYDNATSVGPRETFTLVAAGSNYAFALQPTASGKIYYITAVNGGGIGGPNHNRRYSQINTSATSVGPWQKFAIIQVDPSNPSQVALQAPDRKYYVTAIPGCGGNNDVPFHTNATVIGPWERFTLVPE